MAKSPPVTRVIALEEAFLHPRVWEVFPAPLQQRYALVKKRLMNVGPVRIAAMDAAGIDLQVLSHVQPGVQILTDPVLALAISAEVNDWLGEVVATYPSRFAGFATLPTQSPSLAADELERTVGQHGLSGALINGHTGGHYLDEARFDPLLQRAAALNVPIYLHPTDPPEDVVRRSYDPYTAVLGPSWGFSVETGTHALRMICGGVFDRHPDLKLILGHLGELLPYCYARLSIGLSLGSWLVDAGRTSGEQSEVRMEKPFAYYMKHNVYVTSSGVFEQPVFDCAVAMLGLDNLMFSVDSPFRDDFEAMEFLAACKLTPAEKERFAHGLAEELLGLPPAAARRPRPVRRWKIWSARMRSRVGRALVAALIS